MRTSYGVYMVYSSCILARNTFKNFCSCVCVAHVLAFNIYVPAIIICIYFVIMIPNNCVSSWHISINPDRREIDV